MEASNQAWEKAGSKRALAVPASGPTATAKAQDEPGYRRSPWLSPLHPRPTCQVKAQERETDWPGQVMRSGQAAVGEEVALLASVIGSRHHVLSEDDTARQA